MTTILISGASTQSRARRPLPPDAIGAPHTLWSAGVKEMVEFSYVDGTKRHKMLLTWVVGQWGGIFGSLGGPYEWRVSVPKEIGYSLEFRDEAPGSYGHAAEHDLANALGAVFDGHLTSDDMACRFGLNGGDACAAAVRIARAATGRDRIATQGYHGAHADFAHEPGWAGYAFENVRLHNRFEFGDVPAMRRAARNAACIMVEVPAWDSDSAIALFLHACRETADEYGIPLIVDDVVGGFRFALAGTCERYGVRADMICLGKAMSAVGLVSALIGRADLVGKLADEVFFSTTFGGAPGPCAVAAATVRWLTKNRTDVYGWRTWGGEGAIPIGTSEIFRIKSSTAYKLGHLGKIGSALKDGLNALGVRCVGQPERFIAEFVTEDERRAWCSKMIERGIMVDRPFFPTLAHTMADVEQTLKAAEAISHG